MGSLSMLKFADIILEPESYHAYRAGRLLQLTTFQFTILQFFLKNPGRVFSYRELIDAVWQDSEVNKYAVRRSIVRLRHALNAQGGESLIRSVRSVGYSFDVDGASSEAASPSTKSERTVREKTKQQRGGRSPSLNS